MIVIPQITDLSSINDFWLHDNFLEDNHHKIVDKFLKNQINLPSNNFEGRSVNVGDKKFSLIGTNHYRPYRKLWYLIDYPDYWNQTNETIYDWAQDKYPSIVSPVLRVLMKKILTVEPFVNDQSRWVVLRGIFNILSPGQDLRAHIDTSMYIMDTDKYDTYSATYYTSIEGEGGFFWDERGVLYRPKENTLLINVGSKYTHGVTACTGWRLGVTMRFVRETDLHLPGSVDKLLYKPD